MSIYGTEYEIGVALDGTDAFERVFVQVVPAFIEGEYPSLPPPRLGISEDDGYIHPRAAVFVLEETEQVGQEYVDPLLVLSGEEWERMPFHDVLDKLERALRIKKGQYQ